MDDLSDKINRLLSSPDGMAKIQAAMASLGGMPEQPPAAPSAAPAPSSPPGTATPSGGESPTGGRLPDLSMLTRLMPLLGNINQDDDDSRLLQALKPYLHGDREQRLDEAIRLLRLARLLPLLREQGGADGSHR